MSNKTKTITKKETAPAVIIESNTCNNCANYLFSLKCTAFPNGIPAEILDGSNDHTSPLKDQDNGIIFEQIKYQ